MIEHLYIHIPFCPKVCPYCSFYKELMTSGSREPFVDALIREIAQTADRHELRPRTIFFGGGTPTALTIAQLDRLFQTMRERLDFSRLTEWTIEMNPATVSPEKATLLREAGVTRISMGVQSWDPAILHTLGRVHDVAQAEESYRILRESGIPQVNLDFIFAVPGQTLDQWRATLEKTVALQPDHVSAYNLTYEEDTEFFQRFTRGEFCQEPDADAEFFLLTQQILEDAGYEGYEISNFAPPGKECRHNLAYWAGADYLGLGPSAFSTVGDRRWRNIPNTTEYIERIRAGQDPTDFAETLDAPTRRLEQMAFGLRTKYGITRKLAGNEASTLEDLAREGYLDETALHTRQRVVLTPRGRLLADSIAESLMTFTSSSKEDPAARVPVPDIQK